MSIFVGVRWIGECRRRLPFLLLAVVISFEISYMRSKLLGLCLSMSPMAFCFSSTSKQMTLNSHFALNTGFRVEYFSVDALA